MTPPVMLIIGCGVAGPVLGRLLKHKGYHPIVFEKVQTLGEAGASLMLMPNGMKVLSLVGVADEVVQDARPLTGFWDGVASGETLGHSALPSTFATTYGQRAVGIKRTSINLMLKKMLLDTNIEVREGWQLVGIEETEESVTAVFDGGRRVTGSFLVGCDGIKAASRKAILETQNFTEGVPRFTGLVQVAGISRTPESLGDLQRGSMCNWYGEGVHVIAYPISDTLTSWAVTLPETQEQEETWRLSGQAKIQTHRAMLAARLVGFESTVMDLVRTATRIIKFGLFDREELGPEQWHTGRCVLVGDAAHPTSPHLGQGANQALEDSYHLSQAIPFLDPNEADYTEKLTRINTDLASMFRAYAEKRQPRTSALVKEARAIGEKRVVLGGPAACRERDSIIAAAWSNVDGIEAKWERLLREPF